MRLVLFDIDGTLLNAHGAGKRSVTRALEEVFGTAGPVATHRFGGKTDPQICRELLHLAGVSAAAITSKLPRVLERYLGHLEAELRLPGAVEVLPGVVELLDRLAADPTVTLGLLTGNVREGAKLKLGVPGLEGYFPFGAFGSDDADRTALPRVAYQRAQQHTGHRFEGEQIVIVGDTPADVTCGRSIGARALAVATGPYLLTELIAHQPSSAFATLSVTDEVLAAIRS